MKKDILNLNLILNLLLFLPIWLQAQEAGVIHFTETVKLQIELDEGSRPMMNNLPQSHSVKKILLFKGKESLYKNDTGNEDLDVSNSEGGGEIRMVMRNPESILYTDLAANSIVHSQEFFGKQFLITGAPQKRSWKITSEQKTLLDMTCQKAVLQDTSMQVVAWFTTQIPAAFGPNGYSGLPGAILSMELDKGIRTITATKIEFREVSPEEIVKPDKGKKVSTEEFEKIRKEKMAEMGAVNGGGGTMKIMIRN
ncbi:MAG TPA: GLPGLI family protein [Saprospiraceae bacterium]|nr:GLPGLI family protein [Saprospiraceae bacterium]HNT20993.1 GLPGLI family protein [Saprospiraceae bacterium]